MTSFRQRLSKTSISVSSAKKVLVLNRKGGAGKSTFVMGLASAAAAYGASVNVIDFDIQGSSSFWAKRCKGIHTQQYNPARRTFSEISQTLQIEKNTDLVIFDTPSNFQELDLERYLRFSDAIIIPMQPSPIDVHSILNFLKVLIASPTYRQKKQPISFVATRCHHNDNHFPLFNRVLGKMKYPILGVMNDDKRYQTAFELGLNMLKSFDNLDNALWETVLAEIELKKQ
ncbi:ParA family protein [uncultured Photobacterium sp.]|uniref:ParA family protein n=1 Tax=uncultured Photobacterium sp. TaxID=173973 RepID=UPI0026292C29|nr:ParA family protein [uncultured Photobacterium sp.]